MALEFELGSGDAPLGHAMIYFTQESDPEGSVLVSYVLVLPIKMDLQRYVPQFLAGQLGSMVPDDMSLVILPPVPEKFGKLADLIELAENRGDDLIYGGSMGVQAEGLSNMSKVNEIGHEYMELCKLWKTDGRAIGTDDDSDLIVSLGETVEEERSEEDNLREIARLLGQLRYAVDGRDTESIAQAKERIETIGRALPSKFAVDKLAKLGASEADGAAELTQLYLERALNIQREEYLKVREIEKRIADLEAG